MVLGNGFLLFLYNQFKTKPNVTLTHKMSTFVAFNVIAWYSHKYIDHPKYLDILCNSQSSSPFANHFRRLRGLAPLKSKPSIVNTDIGGDGNK